MKPVAIDFETYLISNEQPAPKPVCLSWATDEDSGIAVGSDMERLLGTFLNGDYLVIAHNFTFEGLVIHKHFPKLRSKLWNLFDLKQAFCTQVYSKLINNVSKKPLPKLSLADLVAFYFEEDISSSKKDPDAWRLRYNELDGVPLKDWPKEAIEYSIMDSVYALKVFHSQKKDHPWLNYGLSVKVEFALNLMANIGISIDLNRVDILEREIKEFLRPRYDTLLHHGYMKQDKKGKLSKNMKLLAEYIKENFQSLEVTPKGNVSTKGEHLQKYLEEKDDMILRCFLDISAYEKVQTAFVANLKQANPVIRTRYNSVVSSGRTSSRKDSNLPSVNIQQMPRAIPGNMTWDVRNCYVPRDGYQLVSIDYAGLELASTAHQLKRIFRQSKMLDTLNEGTTPIDMHSKLACQIKSLADNRRVTYEEFVAHKKEPGYKEFRQLSKPINLGFPGGIGYDVMRSQLLKDGIVTKFEVLQVSNSEREIEKFVWGLNREYPALRKKRLTKTEYALVYDELVPLKAALFRAYPELETFLKEYHNKFLTGESSYVKNDFDEWEEEPMYAFDIYGFKRDWCTYTSFCNGYLMQSPSAIGAKHTMYNIIKKYDQDYRMHPLAFIHDEIVFEVLNNGEKYDIIKDVSEMMIDGMSAVLSTPRIAVEWDLMNYWTKAGGLESGTYYKNPKDKRLYGIG